MSLVLSVRVERLIAVCATDHLLHNVANGICIKNTTGPDLIKQEKIISLSAAIILHCFEELSFSATALHQLKYEAIETAEDTTLVFINCN